MANQSSLIPRLLLAEGPSPAGKSQIWEAADLQIWEITDDPEQERYEILAMKVKYLD